MKSALSLVVEEPITGHCYWMIVRTDWLRASPTLVDAAPGPLPSYAAALSAGNEVLARMQGPVQRPVAAGFGGAWDVRTMPGALA